MLIHVLTAEGSRMVFESKTPVQPPLAIQVVDDYFQVEDSAAAVKSPLKTRFTPAEIAASLQQRWQLLSHS